MKQTPKSCGCGHCRRAKGQNGPKHMMKHEERAFRHGSKINLNKGNEENITAAGRGCRYG